MEDVEVIETNWHKLYNESWNGVIVPDAFQHPAKFSRALIRKIYSHAKDEGWVVRGDSVVDPFGGVALGAFDAMRLGLDWTGCELEQKFVDLGNQNIELWNERYSSFPQWGNARLTQGDSRRLSEAIQGAGLCVSSPPYADAAAHPSIGSVNKDGWGTDGKDIVARRGLTAEYGKTEGNLGNLKASDEGFNLALSSPPYINSMDSEKCGIDFSKCKKDYPGRVHHEERIKGHQKHHNERKYGTTDGQLGSMREGDLSLCVTSPPYEAGLGHGGKQATDVDKEKFAFAREDGRMGSYAYGNSANQVGALRGEDFWSASRQILEQLHTVLSPDARAIFVVKDFIRAKKRVPFTEQWVTLCEAAGFRLIHHHRAMLVEHHGTQASFDGEDSQITTQRKSFFRRLAEKKGSPRIDYESVLCFEKIST